MLLYLLYLLYLLFSPLTQSLLLMNHDCINCKHFHKTVYLKSDDKSTLQSIGYCKLGLDTNSPPTVKVYMDVEEFRTNKNEDNCGTDGKFFKKL